MLRAVFVAGGRMLCLVLLVSRRFLLTLASSELVLRSLSRSDHATLNSSAGHFTLGTNSSGPPVALFWDAAQRIHLYFKKAISHEVAREDIVAFNWGHASSSNLGQSWKLHDDFFKSGAGVPKDKQIDRPSFVNGTLRRLSDQGAGANYLWSNGNMWGTAVFSTKDGSPVGDVTSAWRLPVADAHDFVWLYDENTRVHFPHVLLGNTDEVENILEVSNRHTVSIMNLGSEGADPLTKRSESYLYVFPNACQSLDHLHLERQRILVILCWSEKDLKKDLKKKDPKYDLKYVVGEWGFADKNISRAFQESRLLEFSPLASGHLYSGEETTWKFPDSGGPGNTVTANSGIMSVGWYGDILDGSGFLALRKISILENEFVITAKPWIKTRLLNESELNITKLNAQRSDTMNITGWLEDAGALVFQLKYTGEELTYLEVSFMDGDSQMEVVVFVGSYQMRAAQTNLAMFPRSLHDSIIEVLTQIKIKGIRGAQAAESYVPIPLGLYMDSRRDGSAVNRVDFGSIPRSRSGEDGLTVVLDKGSATVYASAGRAVCSMAHKIDDITRLTNLSVATLNENVRFHSAKLFRYAPVEVTDR